SPAFAGEKTVTLAVKNMYCSACPITVKSSLQAVPGVAKVIVSYADKTAVVTFDDTKTGVPALITATTNARYPSPLNSSARMTDPSLIPTGPIGAILVAACCATPLLAVVLGSIGLTAWLAKAPDYVVMPMLFLGVVLIAFGLYRRHIATKRGNVR